MPFAETPSGRLHYQVCDVVAPWVQQPQTIVFHHGIAANLHLWTAWIPLLASRFRLVRFDMRGFGESVQPPPSFDWSFEQLSEDITYVADAAGIERFHLVGESIGGTAALAFALQSPQRVLSLTLSNAAARGGLVGNVTSWRDIVAQNGQSGWAKQMMQWRFHPKALSPQEFDWFLGIHQTCSMDATFALADLLLKSDLSAQLGQIRLPTLLMSPDASPFIPLDVMTNLRGMIPGAELQVFAHAKHGLPLSHGEACARVLRNFLERHFVD